MTISSTEVIEKPQTEVPTEPAAEKYDLEKAVIDQVMERLGRPTNFIKVTACNVSGDHQNRWRVNVWCNDPVTKKDVFGDSTTYSPPLIKHSYYVHTSPEGGIRKSDPEILKVYKD